MPKIQDSIEVQVPIQQAYNQWTQFEDFPKFMEGIQSVQQLDDTHVHWVAEIRGETREWTTEITEQRPDEKVAWKTIDGEVKNDGVVSFEQIGDQTRVNLADGRRRRVNRRERRGRSPRRRQRSGARRPRAVQAADREPRRGDGRLPRKGAGGRDGVGG